MGKARPTVGSCQGSDERCYRRARTKSNLFLSIAAFSHLSRVTRHGLWPQANYFNILLMVQFESHSAQQMRHAKGFPESLPCPQEFRDIQDILFPSCA